jgi:Uma2 family endonuclease
MSALTLTPPPVAFPRFTKWTVSEFDALGMCERLAGRRPFLLDGAIVEQGPMDPPHANALEVVLEALRAIFGAGWRFRVQTPLHVDLAVVAGKPGYVAAHPTTAALVVEVSDTTLTLDTTEKAERYATAGVQDYWVLDLNGRVLHVYRDPQPLPAALGATAYRVHLELKPGDVVSPLAVPNAVIAIADILP